ncbi:MAG TPA: metal ABC transporter substrate-binding protein [Thermoanaerobaculia bacterium]|jgi:ABC-type Zn uptake system ZnuABC Zn-binding protein ZnuA|nr:metal ABC transporter substrate-binding protein [Thermoanaerobaculia bacterium]
MKRILLFFAVVLLAGNLVGADKLNVVTATEDLASLTREVGGDRVTVTSIAKGYQDPHFVEAKPSFLLLLRKADLLEVVGLDLEIGWLPPLIEQSRNNNIRPGATGYLDVSQGVEILERPTVAVTRAMGDVHPLGNPHYWLDPANAVRIAIQIRNRLAQLRPEDAAYFDQRLNNFKIRINEANKRWLALMAPYRGAKIIDYHPSLPNFAKHFGLQIAGTVEPKPGIPPSPSHTLEIINLIKAQKIKAILMEPYFDRKTPNVIAARTGAKVVVIYPSVGGKAGLDDYFKLFDYDISELTKALR